MLLGEICTRSCGFCSVTTGRPKPLDEDEPRRVADATVRLGLRHVVLTSVNRDELPDGGASAFAATIRAVREANPSATVEALIPDFEGNKSSLRFVLDARPDVLAHNVETVPRLYRQVRPQAKYDRSLNVLRSAHDAETVTKSGIMVGFGETQDELRAVMRDLADVGCDALTIGQYLQPTPTHLRVMRYYSPEEFDELRETALRIGLGVVESGVFVRSSYRAHQQADEALRRRQLEPILQ
jgi:lipoic acid synthetase